MFLWLRSWRVCSCSKAQFNLHGTARMSVFRAASYVYGFRLALHDTIVVMRECFYEKYDQFTWHNCLDGCVAMMKVIGFRLAVMSFCHKEESASHLSAFSLLKAVLQVLY